MLDALTIEGVSKAFGRIKALDNISFKVPLQTICGLLGPNGAGKTTLFSIIASFLKADAGRITVLDTDVRRVADLQGRMTILPQDAQFQRNIPIQEQLVFFLLLAGRTRQAAEAEVRRTLGLVGLEKFHQRGVHSLSHGMIQRLGIAQAFLGEPEVILLDEPTSGLDPQNAKQIRDLIRELRARATIVLSSHNLAEVEELCDHVVILDEGKLVAAGSVAAMTRFGKELDLHLSRELTEAETAALRSHQGVEAIQAKGEARYTLSLKLHGGEQGWDDLIASVLRSLLDKKIVPRRFSEGSTLEALFLKVTARTARQ